MTGTTELFGLGQHSQPRPPKARTCIATLSLDTPPPPLPLRSGPRTHTTAPCRGTGPSTQKQGNLRRTRTTGCMKAIKHPNLQMGGEGDRSRSGPSSVDSVKQSKPISPLTSHRKSKLVTSLGSSLRLHRKRWGAGTDNQLDTVGKGERHTKSKLEALSVGPRWRCVAEEILGKEGLLFPSSRLRI
ncbi:uncharacterized protein UTRI_03405_B [Ustilago trichophora]|uniref:Uncharacterized protein n=1 Tax=Ustilago trichophora TaxID=86804 RepID=A0A5C3E1Y1_9BASI|nr:uncharacterized protein UTRI_03405_B [Ustilago trichophora]